MSQTPVDGLQPGQLGIAVGCNCGTELHVHVDMDDLDLADRDQCEDLMQGPCYGVVRTAVKRFYSTHGSYPIHIAFYTIGANQAGVFTSLHNFEQMTREITELGLDSVGDSILLLLDQAGLEPK